MSFLVAGLIFLLTVTLFSAVLKKRPIQPRRLTAQERSELLALLAHGKEDMALSQYREWTHASEAQARSWRRGITETDLQQ